MARATTRSQRPAQSQPQASQSQPRNQAGGRSQLRDEEEDEDEEADEDGMDVDGMDGPAKELERKANDLVRLALFTEQRRVPLRREEISKKVLGSSSRSFNAVLERAQHILHTVFGMELVELQSRAAEDTETSEKDAELMKTAGMKKRAAPTGTKTYILRSVLAPSLIERACAPDAEIRTLEQTERLGSDEDADDAVDDDDNQVGTRSTGSIFAWHYADQLGSIGILYVILALILVNGKVVGDGDLRALLKRLRLPSSATIPLSTQSMHNQLSVDAYLAQLLRQGYLERARAGEQKGNKRGRVAAATQAPAGEDGANNFEWRWGARARAEVGEKAVAKFVAEFMVSRTGGDESDEDGGRDDPAEAKRLEVVMRGIERAAGSILPSLRA